MAKQTVHIGLAVSTDGLMPSKSNIINLAAAIGNTVEFNINILPQSGTYNESGFWKKHPAEFEALKIGAEPLDQALTKFRTWLRSFQGRLIACCSCIDFWHLFNAMAGTGDCPFGSIPIDTNSYYAALMGNRTPGRVTDKVIPLDVAKERWYMVTEGRLPAFGKAKTYKPPRPKADPYNYMRNVLIPNQVPQQFVVDAVNGRVQRAHAPAPAAARVENLQDLWNDNNIEPVFPPARQ